MITIEIIEKTTPIRARRITWKNWLLKCVAVTCRYLWLFVTIVWNFCLGLVMGAWTAGVAHVRTLNTGTDAASTSKPSMMDDVVLAGKVLRVVLYISLAMFALIVVGMLWS